MISSFPLYLLGLLLFIRKLLCCILPEESKVRSGSSQYSEVNKLETLDHRTHFCFLRSALSFSRFACDLAMKSHDVAGLIRVS